MRAFTLTPPKPTEQPERDVTQEVCEYLARLGWYPERRHVGKFVPLRVAYQAIEMCAKGKLKEARQAISREIITMGTEGDPDYLFVHPWYMSIYVEMKATKGSIRPEQLRRVFYLQQLGFKATIACDLESFKAWYQENVVPHPCRS